MSIVTDYLERTKIPRLPWHDIACCVYGEPAADVARHFKQRFHFTVSKNISTFKTNLTNAVF